MAKTLYATNIYSNDGSQLLWQGCIESAMTITLSSNGATFYCKDKFTGEWRYIGGGTFKGLATSSGASSPTYAVGSSFATAQSTLNLYIVVEGGGGGGSSSARLTISYDGENLVSTTVSGKATKTLLCAGKVMASDVAVSVESG